MSTYQTINYELYGHSSKTTIVFLHGWGAKGSLMKPMADPLAKKNRVLVMDLPGFGQSPEPTSVWSIDDYVKAIHDLIVFLKLDDIVLVGHSFGGKLALLYASKYPVTKLVVLAAPFDVEIKQLSLKTKLLKALYQVPFLKKLGDEAKKHLGSLDYQQASPLMRQVLTLHINTDITEEVKHISCPTLLIWGDQDEMVNVSKAYQLEALIKDAAVVIYPGCTHFAYVEDLNRTIAILSCFIEGEQQ